MLRLAVRWACGVRGRPLSTRPAVEAWPQAKVDRFGGVTVRFPPSQHTDEAAFQSWLRDAIQRWREEGRIAVWMHIPITLSGLISYAAKEGFLFHHAENDTSTLTLWLRDGPSRLPGYATHQIGVAGAVLDEDTGKVLVVQDKNKVTDNHPYGTVGGDNRDVAALWCHLLLSYCHCCRTPELGPGDATSLFCSPLRHLVVDNPDVKNLVKQDVLDTTKTILQTLNAWKFPGGLSDPGEDLGDTAVREVLEETGIKSEFRSLLSIRQQHNHPGGFGKSDMYIICRLKPLSYNISFCPHECLKCEWMDLQELAYTNHTTPITSRIAKLLLYGYKEGFHNIDLPMKTLPAVYSGRFYNLYHKDFPDHYETKSKL